MVKISLYSRMVTKAGRTESFYRNLMKKIIAAILLLFCTVVVLLATIDLGPYLAPEKAPDPAPGNTTRLHPGVTTESIEETEQTPQTQQIQTDDPVHNSFPEPPVEEIFPEQEQVVINPQTTSTEVTEEEVAETPPPPIELEVTTLPPGEYPFSILVGTFQKKETAQRAISLYRKRGISTYWVKVDLEERGVRYRQFTGFFASIPEAEQYLNRNELVDKLIKPTYYSARLGVYTDKTVLARDFVKARQADVIPYILGTPQGDYYLYVGAFYTYVGAVDQCRDLAATGLTCEPVKRSTIPQHQP